MRTVEHALERVPLVGGVIQRIKDIRQASAERRLQEQTEEEKERQVRAEERRLFRERIQEAINELTSTGSLPWDHFPLNEDGRRTCRLHLSDTSYRGERYLLSSAWATCYKSGAFIGVELCDAENYPTSAHDAQLTIYPAGNPDEKNIWERQSGVYSCYAPVPLRGLKKIDHFRSANSGGSHSDYLAIKGGQTGELKIRYEVYGTGHNPHIVNLTLQIDSQGIQLKGSPKLQGTIKDPGREYTHKARFNFS